MKYFFIPLSLIMLVFLSSVYGQSEENLEEIERIGDENEYEPLPREWQTSGPFQIDRSQYALGEKIFLKINELDFEEKGKIEVIRILNDTHYLEYLSVPFDGSNKDTFNYYLKPQLSKTQGLCSVDDILGKWTLIFRGTNYSNIDFEIVNKTVPGSSWEPVCLNSEELRKENQTIRSSLELETDIDIETPQKIPDWVKNTMGWFADGLISEDEMISAIQFLINEGIIKLK
jgi:hypothetical protein